jgi:hypothetical protein
VQISQLKQIVPDPSVPLLADLTSVDSPATAPAIVKFPTESELLAASQSSRRALSEALSNRQPPPAQSNVVIVGATTSGLSLAAAFSAEGSQDITVLEKSGTVGGLWARHASSFSRMHLSAPGYQLPISGERIRSSLKNPYAHDMLADVLDVIETHDLVRRTNQSASNQPHYDPR